jgi:hypothetical protein
VVKNSNAYLIESEALLGQLALVKQANLPLLARAIYHIPGWAELASISRLVVLERIIHDGF